MEFLYDDTAIGLLRRAALWHLLFIVLLLVPLPLIIKRLSIGQKIIVGCVATCMVMVAGLEVKLAANLNPVMRPTPIFLTTLALGFGAAICTRKLDVHVGRVMVIGVLSVLLSITGYLGHSNLTAARQRVAANVIASTAINEILHQQTPFRILKTNIGSEEASVTFQLPDQRQFQVHAHRWDVSPPYQWRLACRTPEGRSYFLLANGNRDLLEAWAALDNCHSALAVTGRS